MNKTPSDATGLTACCSYPNQSITKLSLSLSLSLGHVTTQSFRSGIVTLTLWPAEHSNDAGHVNSGVTIFSLDDMAASLLSFMDNLLTLRTNTPPNKKSGGSTWHRTVTQNPYYAVIVRNKNCLVGSVLCCCPQQRVSKSDLSSKLDFCLSVHHQLGKVI